MNVKRFVADSMQLALRQVTQELGADAVIISSKKIADGIEVVAALNYQKGDEKTQAAEVNRQVRLQRELDAVKKETRRQRDPEYFAERVAYAKKADLSNTAGIRETLSNLKNDQYQSSPKTNTRSASSASDKKYEKRPTGNQLVEDIDDLLSEPAVNNDHGYQTRLTAMQDELRELKNWMVSHQGSAWDTERPLTWKQSQLWQRCQDMGIESVWCDRIASQISDALDMKEAWQSALSSIARDLPIAPRGILEQGGRYALVGPTGAGKTTTVGKLAAQYVMRYGSDAVAFITLDNYRVAAHDQLRAFAKILGVEMYVVNREDELRTALQKTQKKKLVLIDSAGLSSQDPHFESQLSMLKKTGTGLKKLLVLPLTSQARCLQENFEHFKAAGLSGCVFTKLDECFSLGAGMSIAALGHLPVTLVTDGPHIPDDIHYPDAKRLVGLAEQMARMAKTRWQAAAAMSMATEQTSFHHGV